MFAGARPRPSARRTEADVNRIYSLSAGALLIGAVYTAGAPASAPTRPGPDSAQVVHFLSALGAADPIICDMAVDNLGNNWGSRSGREPVGVLRDWSPADRVAREAFGHSVDDPRALPVLVDHLGDPNPCVRRAAARMLGADRSELARRMLRAKLRDSQA